MHDGPLPDADDYPDPQVLMAHVPHPDAPDLIRRSSLVVGSKGSGKSFLLKYQQLKNYPRAFLLKIPAELSGVAVDIGMGGKAEYFEPEQRQAIQGKAAALFAATILKLAARHRQDEPPLPFSLLEAFLPRNTDLASGFATAATGQQAKAYVNELRLEEWRRGPSLDQLQDFAGELKEHYGELPVFLLDRAEDTSSPALEVLMKFMDQSVSALTVIAARPALSQLVPEAVDGSMQPGDHYELIHLGVDPYGEAWQAFAHDAVANYFRTLQGEDSSQMEQPWAQTLARDSLKWAIRFTAIGRETSGQLTRRAELLNRDRNLLLTRADTFLKLFNSETTRFFETVRSKIPNLASRPPVAVTLAIEGMGSTFSIFSERGQAEKMIQAGLRSETFSLPSNVAWHPYEVPAIIDLNPLLAWDGANELWIQ